MIGLEKITLGRVATFTPGTNQSRMEKQLKGKRIIYYDQDSFEKDCQYHTKEQTPLESLEYLEKFSVREGEIVISNSLHLATMVSKENAHKVLPLNFTKVDINSEKLDPYYFIYMFNEYREVQRQKERELQGTGMVMRLSIKSLESLKIPFIPLEEQKKIGTVYIETQRLEIQLAQYAKLLQQFTSTLLEENLKHEARRK